MFNISRKKALIRSLIAGLIVTFAVVFVANFVINDSNTDVEAANTAGGDTVQVIPGAAVGYEGWTTNYFQVKSGDNQYEGMCADPMKGTPSGNWSAIKIDNEDDWQKDIKLMLYIFYVNTDANVAYLDQIFQYHPDYAFRYGHVHAVVAYLKTHGADTTGLGAGAIQWVQTVIGELDAMRAGVEIAGSSTRWQEAQDYQLYITDTSTYPGLQSIMWIEHKDIQYGKIQVLKFDTDVETGGNAAGLSFAGTTFELLKYETAEVVATKTIGNNECPATGSNCVVEFNNVPYGNYYVKEKTASAGYNIDTTLDAQGRKPVSLSMPLATVNFYNTPKKGSITVDKIDSETGSCTNTGGLNFNNISFELYNNTGGRIKYNNTFINNGAKVATVNLNTSNCKAVFNDITYGKYTVKEVSTNQSYNIDTESKEITLSGNSASISFSNTPKKGKIIVTKVDKNTGTCSATGNSTLAGISFKLFNNTGGNIKYNNTTYANGALIATQVIDSNCKATFDGLPYGVYKIQEAVPTNNGYIGETDKTITLSGSTAEITFSNSPKLGNLTVNKKDKDTNSCTTVGDASFEGVTFSVTNNSINPIYYGGKIFAKGAVITTKALDAATCSVVFEKLPYGTYIVKEVGTGVGYKTNTASNSVTIPTNDSPNVSTTFTNEAILGKVTVNKIDSDTNSCTNSRGLSFEGTMISITNDSKKPIYYGGRSVAKGAVIDTKTMGANQCNITFENLPYGTYLIKETKASKGYVADAATHKVTIPSSGTNVNASTTLSNQPIRGDLKFIKMDTANNKPMRDVIFSITAIDSNFNLHETHIVMSDKNGVVDTSSSFALHSFHTNGYDALYDEVDPLSFLGYGDWFGEDANGNAIPVRDEVGALPYGKYIVQELRCGSNLFCNNILGEKLIVEINEHNKVVDLGDWDNACIKFSLATQASDEKDGDKYIEVGKDVKLKDTIDYCVKANTDFRIKGILMDKSTGEPLIVNGNTVEQEIKLNSEEECGTTSMTFTFDGSELGGKELVVFETLYYKDDIITKHDDIEDEGQTVEMVKLRTTATNNETGEKTLPLDADVDIKDVVSYCLKPGYEYTLKGVLMDKSTGNGLLVNSELVESEVTFTLEETDDACGEVEMHFKLNTSNLGGKELVVFESLYRGEDLIIEHKDINDEGETVVVDLPAPDTGMMTRSSEHGTSGNMFIVIVSIGTVIGVGSYIVSRKLSRNKFMKKW